MADGIRARVLHSRLPSHHDGKHEHSQEYLQQSERKPNFRRGIICPLFVYEIVRLPYPSSSGFMCFCTRRQTTPWVHNISATMITIEVILSRSTHLSNRWPHVQFSRFYVDSRTAPIVLKASYALLTRALHYEYYSYTVLSTKCSSI